MGGWLIRHGSRTQSTHPESCDESRSPRIPLVCSFVSWQPPFEYVLGFKVPVWAAQDEKCASVALHAAAALSTYNALCSSEHNQWREAGPNLCGKHLLGLHKCCSKNVVEKGTRDGNPSWYSLSVIAIITCKVEEKSFRTLS